ncbi:MULTISPECIES: hypothetical protein [unclassified Pseudomonas]|uniref:hypothetical protein n=1 Tax=unclassified Pseudomonas TaxID=196821 RepID=UPI001913D117|nr:MULTISPECIES: hypothetical protein [unclassified Pseudomonas]MBK5550970.1 hypothetical protein [Pseudomonas sp. TH03]MEB0224539.1 hypothetical protein [Pseudomonas sp. 5S1]MEB0296442.1 hypothetical protein [Pseudomonas sp. 10S4]WPX18800.1 hypothetical protein RHM58_01300 [Pseudomonas sp. 10S4]
MAEQQTAPIEPEYGYWYTPLAGKHYPSPLQVTGFYHPGVGERKDLRVYFFGPYGEVAFKDFSFTTREFAFQIPLAPGPYDVNWDVKWRDDWDQMTHIQKFYVRTPPE